MNSMTDGSLAQALYLPGLAMRALPQINERVQYRVLSPGWTSSVVQLMLRRRFHTSGTIAGGTSASS